MPKKISYAWAPEKGVHKKDVSLFKFLKTSKKEKEIISFLNEYFLFFFREKEWEEKRLCKILGHSSDQEVVTMRKALWVILDKKFPDQEKIIARIFSQNVSVLNNFFLNYNFLMEREGFSSSRAIVDLVKKLPGEIAKQNKNKLTEPIGELGLVGTL